MATDDSGGPRTAFVTGASSGIGSAIARAFGDLGWRVGIGARGADALDETARAINAAGGRAFAHPLDVRDTASVDEFFRAAESALGPVDVLVNNAGVARPGALHEVDDDVHRRIVETNLLGPIYLSRRAIRSMLERGGAGDLVFISSDVTVHPRPKMPAYGATKAGVEHLATTLALELEGTAIRTSVVRVGPTLTGFGDEWDPDVFDTLIPQWQRFGLQRHWHTNDAATVARAVVSVVTLERGSTISVLEVQPTPPVE
ncbi:MAG TPA: SDR family NAD(P)-dependent oxidoreductase [Acidimicrobiia bacterium]|nr:SDR family NAD(P)-dependent oxidoreductase [Acidimicrobiia bacterium]